MRAQDSATAPGRIAVEPRQAPGTAPEGALAPRPVTGSTQGGTTPTGSARAGSTQARSAQAGSTQAPSAQAGKTQAADGTQAQTGTTRPPAAAKTPAPDHRRAGTLQAALGVIAFSLTFPATAWGLEGIGPWSLVALRCALGAVVAGGCLLALRVPLPARAHWAGLAVVGGGVVVGFPLLTSLALQTSSTAHAAVVVGLLPLTTAVLSALRTGTRPSRTFWAAAIAGAVAVAAFTVQQSGGALSTADLYLFGALLVCAAGYTEGGRLARHMPGWQVIGWALVLCLPLNVVWAVIALRHEPFQLTWHSTAGLLYLAIGSQFLGLLVWYRGMAAIGIPKASQLQLAQPLLTLVWSLFLLGEDLTPAAPLTAVAVLVCIAVTQRARG
ncbi:DMT family transporter [Streptomyces flavofungini]|uniref:DMT family transporter n=1 Tax=Streptomyces flavofungini TaxID=68200 RepID=UPI0025B05F67|nr:EamA family transporter [Streptomyces flavofungini]WJV49941.1 EamA family transporter [Streptomyces flavofungini]